MKNWKHQRYWIVKLLEHFCGSSNDDEHITLTIGEIKKLFKIVRSRAVKGVGKGDGGRSGTPIQPRK